ncbi:DUF3348 domain-containing protein [Accumulibacter sp.]|uniref:DUF3348 domain-containing protein n=1 Tax=Accumulibacter sp. TaxID=2053492 RepID=UPI002CDAC571|nr:DUF3348 domain-containing protein [Accumulibacter sp.]HPU80091.1 DUF3348 domain-containing protein [Accumulibacter sp.]
MKFHDSNLIRILADLCLVEAAESKPVFAERLGQWLDFSDAITLHAAHNARAASSSTAQPGVQSVVGVAVEEEFVRTRTALVDSITKSCSANMGEARIRLPTPKPGVGNEVVVAYEPYRRFYVAHQGAMELSIRSLRTRVRQALSRASTALKQLAALDEALDRILCVRERQLLSTVPLLLEKRFEQLLKAHPQPPVGTRQADAPALRRQPGEGLADFCKELQGVLLAELELRLQPTAGLIEALRNEANKQK